jgi:hypothetical protein
MDKKQLDFNLEFDTIEEEELKQNPNSKKPFFP